MPSHLVQRRVQRGVQREVKERIGRMFRCTSKVQTLVFGLVLVGVILNLVIFSSNSKIKWDRAQGTQNYKDDIKIHSNYFSDVELIAKQLEHAQSYRRENATIMTLCQEADLDGVVETVRKLEDRFNRNYHYDWVFLNNEEFSKDFQEKVSLYVSGTAKFGKIPTEHWSYPDHIDLDKAKEGRDKMVSEKIIYGGSESYRHMCRFNSGFFYKHPLMQQYKYYWRVEPHVDFTCDINFDPFRYLRENNKLYGFTISIHEFVKTIPSLWDTTKRFLQNKPHHVAENNLINFISNDNGETYNLCHFWSNFEIADMDFWRSDAYEEYFRYLDQSGGFFYERWGDAPVHSIAISLFAQRDKIHFFDQIGYRHGPYQMCPTNNDIFTKNRCFCPKDKDFTLQSYSCGTQYFASQK